MTLRQARLPGEIRLGVEKIDRRSAWRVLYIKCAACQDFIEIPRPPRRNAGGRGMNNGLDFALRNRLEDPLQDQQIDIFMTERKKQVIGKGIAGPVAFIEDRPDPLFPVAAPDMLLRHAAWPPDRRGNRQRLHKRRPSGEFAAVGDALLLEDCDWSRVKFHRSKILCFGRK